MVGGPGLLLLPLLAGLGSAVSDPEPPRNIQMMSEEGNISATWDWIYRSDKDMDGNFTAFYQELGMAASEIPGCVHIDAYRCNIPSELLDFSKNYTLHVRVETAQGNAQSDSVSFQPNLIAEQLPIPSVYLVLDDWHVIVNISTPVHHVYAKYIVVLQNMNSSAERHFRPLESTFEIMFEGLGADVRYCLRAQVYDLQIAQYSPFSEPSCFKATRVLPENLRVDAVNTRFLLKWDWDYQQNPNVTFSVMEGYLNSWRTLDGCENITTTECNVSKIYQFGSSKFLVSVYNSQTDAKNSNVFTFNPSRDTLMGPPTKLEFNVQNNDLYITVGAPEGFNAQFLRLDCTWKYHLESWRNSTPEEIAVMRAEGPHFKREAVEFSTTYCARAKTYCGEGNRTGLYSEIYCFTTDARSYVKEWIIGSVFGGIIVISVILYICLCPLKRYLKHVFFPKSKLPSSIEKGLQDSPQNYIKNFFLLHDEETTEKCYIIQNSPEDNEGAMDTKSSGAKGRDSGNYSNEDEVTGSSAGSSP